MDPMTLSLIANAAGSGLQSALGIGQLIGGLATKVKRPDYEIPKEIRNMLALRQMNLQGRMPGATEAQRNIQQSQANTVERMRNVSSNPNAILAGLSASQGQTNRALNQLGVQEKMDYQRRLAGLERAQTTMAGFRDKEFQLNEYQPYLDKAKTKAALMGAGLRNITGGISGFGQAAGERGYMDMMMKMYGGQQQAQGTQPAGASFDMDVPSFDSPTQIPEAATSGGLGINALQQSYDFNQWLKQNYGTNVTNLSPMQRAYMRQQYGQ